MKINPDDLVIEIFANKKFPDVFGASAVRFIHKPTNISAECNDHRSYAFNKHEAMARLQVKITELEYKESEK